MDVYLSLGSNIGSRIDKIESAIKCISKISEIKKISSFYITSPMYYVNQPYFINCALKIKTDIEPIQLIKKILQIEKNLGRIRTFKNGPRIIDIDIVYYGSKVIDKSILQIPHPKRLERTFVLKPISDIEPSLKDPLTNKTISQMLTNLNTQELIKLPENYNESLKFLSSLKPRNKNDFKIDYMKETLKAIGNPQDKIGRIIHITGSEGKTSTAIYISKILQKNGYRTALYTSPHIIDIRERIRFNGKMISKKNFLTTLRYVISSSPHIHSAFEYLTLVALKYFSQISADFSIIEVGMGGVNDATNVFEKSYCVFTHISNEHSKYLGRSIKKIAENKAGIIKENSKCFISNANSREVIKIIEKKAREKNCYIYIQPDKLESDIYYSNLNLAKWICERILYRRIKYKDIRIKIPARKQKIKYKGREIILDGAHTPYSIKKIMSKINTEKYRVCLCGFMRDKKVYRCLGEIIKKGFKKIIITQSLSPRTMRVEEIKTNERKIAKIKLLKKAFSKALKYGNICVLGSLYLCGDIISIIKGKKRIYLNELY